MTSPGSHATAFAGLPAGVAALADVAHGLIVHEYMTGNYGFDLAEERRATVHIRPVASMLDRILAEDGRPLTIAREPARRFAGDCRHFTVLTVAMLRAQGIPARARCGFGGYFGTGWFEDHWVCEYWNAPAGRWALADAQIDDVQRKMFGIAFDVLDTSRTEFLVAGDAWARCRAGEADPARFGLSFMNEGGAWWIAQNLIRDVAALNNMEMLPWDVWGAMPRPDDLIGDELTELLDRLAALTADPDIQVGELADRYRSDPRLTVPATVYSAALRRDDAVP
jgi:Transglutaminase-like superfamily